jgi:carbamoyl-phosphate synthase large subunit
MNILVTSVGQRVSLVRILQKEMYDCGLKGAVFTTDMFPELSAACNISDKYFKISKVASSSYIDELLSLCIDNGVKMVIPTIDTELIVLAENKELFKRKDINIIISSIDFIKICRDKRKTNIFFRENDISVPDNIDKNNPTFPLFIKPYDGSLSADTYLIRSKEELRDYHLLNDKFMFMEYIDRNEYDEYTVDMYYGKDHRVKSIIPRKRLAIRAGEILKGLTCKNEIVGFLKKRLGFIEGAIGCLTLQLFYCDNKQKIFGIEINPRFGGGFPLSYNAGGNYPGWLIKEYLFNEEIDYYDNWEDSLLMLRYDDEVLVHGYKD